MNHPIGSPSTFTALPLGVASLAAALFLTGGTALAQGDSGAGNSRNTLVRDFQDSVRRLAADEALWNKQAANACNREAWWRDIAPRVVTLHEKALALPEHPPQRLGLGGVPRLGDDLSPACRQLLVFRAEILNDADQYLNAKSYRPETTNGRSSEHEANASRQSALRLLAAQATLASKPPAPVLPSPLRIPAGASPELAQLLSRRHALLASRSEFMKQEKPATREEYVAAERRWCDENAVKIDEMQQSAVANSESKNNP